MLYRYGGGTYFLTFSIMRSVNKVVLMGHLAADPELKSTTNGISVARFKIATNRDWQSSDGERHEATDYHKIVAWRKLAEICAEYLKSGSGVYLEGRIMNHKFQDKQGVDRLTTEIVADLVNFVTYKKSKGTEQVNLTEVPAV